MTKMAMISFTAIFLLLLLLLLLLLPGLSPLRVSATPVSLRVSTVGPQNVRTGSSLLQLNSVGLASDGSEMPVIEDENGVVVFVLDSFQGEESHGENVLRIIKENSFDKGKVEIVDLGHAISKK